MTVIAYFNYLLPKETGENHNKFRIAANLAKVWMRHIPNTSLNHHWYNNIYAALLAKSRLHITVKIMGHCPHRTHIYSQSLNLGNWLHFLNVVKTSASCPGKWGWTIPLHAKTKYQLWIKKMKLDISWTSCTSPYTAIILQDWNMKKFCHTGLNS
jgi:hypothetical protein